MLGLHQLKGIGTSAIVVHFAGVATLVTAGICLLPPALPFGQVREPTIALLLIGVGATALIGQLCLTRAFATGKPAKVSVVALSQIVFALGLDLLFGIPGFHLSTLAGIALVLAPTAWVILSRSQDEGHVLARPTTPNQGAMNGEGDPQLARPAMDDGEIGSSTTPISVPPQSRG